MDLRTTYNRIAEDWATDHAVDTWWIEGTTEFCKLLKPGSAILDVGCGGGFKTKFLADRGFAVKGTDFSESMIAAAGRKYPTLDFAVRDLHDIDQEPGTYDAIFAQAVLLHIKKIEVLDVLAKMKSRLNAGGFIYVAVKAHREGKPDEEVVKENDYGYEYERFFSYYSMTELENYFRELDMVVVSQTVTSSGRTNWLQVVAQKQ